MQVKLAEALLRRKELQQKVDQLFNIKQSDMAEMKVKRINVADGIDEVTALVPQVKVAQITRAYDWHARQLRLVDAAIQQANWVTEIEVNDSVMQDFSE